MKNEIKKDGFDALVTIGYSFCFMFVVAIFGILISAV